jgi:hypothetical protein
MKREKIIRLFLASLPGSTMREATTNGLALFVVMLLPLALGLSCPLKIGGHLTIVFEPFACVKQ